MRTHIRPVHLVIIGQKHPRVCLEGALSARARSVKREKPRVLHGLRFEVDPHQTQRHIRHVLKCYDASSTGRGHEVRKSVVRSRICRCLPWPGVQRAWKMRDAPEHPKESEQHARQNGCRAGATEVKTAMSRRSSQLRTTREAVRWSATPRSVKKFCQWNTQYLRHLRMRAGSLLACGPSCVLRPERRQCRLSKRRRFERFDRPFEATKAEVRCDAVLHHSANLTRPKSTVSEHVGLRKAAALR